MRNENHLRLKRALVFLAINQRLQMGIDLLQTLLSGQCAKPGHLDRRVVARSAVNNAGDRVRRSLRPGSGLYAAAGNEQSERNDKSAPRYGFLFASWFLSTDSAAGKAGSRITRPDGTKRGNMPPSAVQHFHRQCPEGARYCVGLASKR